MLLDVRVRICMLGKQVSEPQSRGKVPANPVFAMLDASGYNQ